MITPDYYFTARTIILEFFTTIDGLIMPAVNLNDCCNDNA